MFLLFFVSGSPRLYLHSLPSVPSLWDREGGFLTTPQRGQIARFVLFFILIASIPTDDKYTKNIHPKIRMDVTIINLPTANTP